MDSSSDVVLLICEAAQISAVMFLTDLCVFAIRLCRCISCPSRRRSFRPCSPCCCRRRAVCPYTRPCRRLETDPVLWWLWCVFWLRSEPGQTPNLEVKYSEFWLFLYVHYCTVLFGIWDVYSACLTPSERVWWWRSCWRTARFVRSLFSSVQQQWRCSTWSLRSAVLVSADTSMMWTWMQRQCN